VPSELVQPLQIIAAGGVGSAGDFGGGCLSGTTSACAFAARMDSIRVLHASTNRTLGIQRAANELVQNINNPVKGIKYVNSSFV